jgi:hypothetical protein
MAKNYDIKTASKFIVGGAAASAAYRRATIGSSVAAGMTRYVTFLRLVPMEVNGDKGSKVYICSTAASDTATTSTLASANQKMVMFIASTLGTGVAGNRSEMIPASPDTEHPLFTIASSKFLTAYIGSDLGMSGAAQLFVQYFDE